MRASGIVFKARAHVGATTPPAPEDVSRVGDIGAFQNTAAWTQLPSGLWVVNILAVNDRILWGNNPELNWTTGPVTFEFWRYKDPSDVNGRIILARATYDVSGWRMDELATGVIQLLTHQAAAHDTVQTLALSLGTWRHIAIGRDDAGDGFAYVNGVESAGAGVGVALTSPVSHSAVFETGSTVSSCIGMVGLPRIYTYAMDVNQVAAHFAAERDWFGV